MFSAPHHTHPHTTSPIEEVGKFEQASILTLQPINHRFNKQHYHLVDPRILGVQYVEICLHFFFLISEKNSLMKTLFVYIVEEHLV